MGTATPAAAFLATARRVKNCPLHFKPGDRMVFALPAISKEDSDQVCALAIHDLIPVIQKMEKGATGAATSAFSKAGIAAAMKGGGDLGFNTFCTGCKAINAFVEFDLTRGAPPSQGADTASIQDAAQLELLAALKEFKIFAPLPTSSLIRALPCVRRREMESGAMVLEKGHRGDHLWLLLEGQVEVITVDANDVETVIATLGKGEVMGEMSLLTGEPVAATIRCKGDAKFLSIEKHDFERLLAANPAINMYFTRLLADRLKATSRRFMSEIEKGVLGYLNMIGPPELVQALEATGRTGLLVAKEGDRSIEVYLHEGHVYRITPGGSANEDPEEAFFAFLGWRKGTFRFEPGARDEERVFFKDATSLLLEGLRRLDEAGATPE